MSARATKRSAERYVWQIKVELLDVAPTIWRRLIIPYDVKLPDLHRVLQTAFGWSNCHLHQFTIHGIDYAEPDPDSFDRHPPKDERRVQLCKAAPPAVRSFDYLYDFGDHWHHVAIIEHHHPERSDALHLVQCIDGANAAPPEDVGGHPGYAEFRKAIADPAHREHRSLLEWVGGAFDSTRFEIAKVNRALAKLAV